MKKAWILAFALLFVSVTGFAAPPAPALSAAALAQILGQPAAGGACGLPQDAVAAAAKPAKPSRPGANSQEKALCSAFAWCGFGASVSCNGNNSVASCSGYDRDCYFSNEPGHVTCDGVTTWCPMSCEDCTQGNYIQQACCRCDLIPNCNDCYVCEHGYESPHACG